MQTCIPWEGAKLSLAMKGFYGVKSISIYKKNRNMPDLVDPRIYRVRICVELI